MVLSKFVDVLIISVHSMSSFNDSFITCQNQQV